MPHDKGGIIVVGAGAFGLAAAIELRRRGWSVTVLDAAAPPAPRASSTDISKAVRMDYGDDELYTALAERAIVAWRQWNRRASETLFHEVGFLLLTREPLRAGTFEGESFALLRRRGHALQRVTSSTIGGSFPAWGGADLADGYFNPTAGWAPSARVVARLAAAAREGGVELVPDRGVARLLERGSRIAGVETVTGETLTAEFVLVAAGAWTPALVPWLADRMHATAQAVLHFEPHDPSLFMAQRFPVWAVDISTTGWYGFPINADGVVKVGNHGAGRRMAADAPNDVDAAEERRFRAFLRGNLPALADAPRVGGRLCFYCDTTDGDFLIDHDPLRPGLVVAAGGSGHGFKFVPVIGEIIADVVERRGDVAGGRFAWQRPAGPYREQARSF